MKSYRRILIIRWEQKITNDEVCSRVWCRKNMVQQITERKLNLFGHICRMLDNRLVKEMMFGMMEAETRGRPCREWLDDIKEWCGGEIYKLNRKVQDCGTWRSVVKTALDPKGRWAHGWMGYIMYASLLLFFINLHYLYCIVSIHLYSASCSAHQSEVLPVRETPREESSLERTKRGTWLTS